MYCKAVYLNFLAYVSASPCNTPTSVPGRLAAVGFGWFLLITIASYTANLASILVAQQKATNQIGGIEDAIAQKRSICLHPVIAPEIKAAYPKAILVQNMSSTSGVIRALRKGECGVALVQVNKIETAMAGTDNELDCKRIDDGMTPAEASDTASGAHCVRDTSGKPDMTEFCRAFRQVGQKVVSVPVSMPISAELVQSFSYTFQKMHSSGSVVQVRREEELRLDGKLGSSCTETRDNTDSDLRLSLSSMTGTFVIAFFIQAVALLLGIFEYFTQRTIQDWLGLYDHHLQAPPPEHGDHGKSHALTRVEFVKHIDELKELLGVQQHISAQPMPSSARMADLPSEPKKSLQHHQGTVLTPFLPSFPLSLLFPLFLFFLFIV
jgi:hypothetical protein